MAVLKPFRGYHYSQRLIEKGHIGELVAPPYDVISRRKKELLARNPQNIVHVILGKDDSGYQNAAKLFRNWLAKEVIERDSLPAFYVYEQEFTVPRSGEKKVRTGFITLVRIEEFEKRIILPHEKTMPKYSQDRLELLRATEANLEQIFGIFNESTMEVDSLLEESKKRENLLMEFVDFDGVLHRIFRISDTRVIDRIRRLLNPRTIILADGHHRYETSLMYRQEVREKLGDPPGDLPADYVMMTLVNLKNPGLLVLPTHRLIHGLPVERIKDFFKRCEEYFVVHLFEGEESMELFLEQAPPNTIGVYDKVEGTWGCITLRDRRIMDEKLGKEDVNRYLDTSVLHKLVFEEILGIDEETQKKNLYVDYLRGTKDVFQIANEENEYQLVFVMKPTPLEDVERAVHAFQRMPQKSTYFYPKVWSGLIMRLLEEE